MKKGGRCLTLLAFMLLGGLVTVFIVMLVVTQLVAGAQRDAQATFGPLVTNQALATQIQPTATHLLVESTAADLGVTIDAPLPVQPSIAAQVGATDVSSRSSAPVTATSIGTPTTTPTLGELGLGTPSFPLTLTVQHAQDQTRVAGRLNSINATATEDARQSQIIFATLTAAAAQKAGK